jgi:hypothetical protein
MGLLSVYRLFTGSAVLVARSFSLPPGLPPFSSWRPFRPLLASLSRPF